MKKIIKVENLTKIYNGKVLAVDHISFDVFEGEIFGFLGPNGAGKTTTIHMLTTLIPLSEGDAYIDGLSIRRDTDSIRRIIGLVPQELTADDELTGWENMMLQASIYRMNKKEAVDKALELLEMVDLLDAKDRLVKTYSGGMRRRLELVMGLIHNPKVLFLDEPTLGLDVQTRAKIWEYIKDLRDKQGITIFLTTHYMEEADYLCDRIGIIDMGRIKALDTPEELKRKIKGDIIVVKTSSRLSEADTLLSDIPGYKEVKYIGDKLTIAVEKGEEALPHIIRKIMSQDGEITSIEVLKPSLEQVFLYLTGRKIREEEPLDTVKTRILRRRLRQ